MLGFPLDRHASTPPHVEGRMFSAGCEGELLAKHPLHHRGRRWWPQQYFKTAEELSARMDACRCVGVNPDLG